MRSARSGCSLSIAIVAIGVSSLALVACRCSAWCSAPPSCRRRRTACSAPRSPPSVSVSSAMRRSASGSAAMRASRPPVRSSRPPRWAYGGNVFSTQTVFLVTAILCVPALIAIATIRGDEIDPVRAHGGKPRQEPASPLAGLRSLARNGPLVTFAVCRLVFHLSECRHDAAGRDRDCDARGRLGDDAGRRVCHRPATGRRSLFAPDRLARPNGRAPAADPDALCRVGFARHALRDRRQSVPDCRRANPRRPHGRYPQRDWPARGRRRHARNRALQSGGGHRRRLHGSWRRAQHHARRADQHGFWQQRDVSCVGRPRRAGIYAGAAAMPETRPQIETD